MRTLLAVLVLSQAAPALAQVTGDVPARRPAAVVDLRTEEGTRRRAGGPGRQR